MFMGLDGGRPEEGQVVLRRETTRPREDPDVGTLLQSRRATAREVEASLLFEDEADEGDCGR